MLTLTSVQLAEAMPRSPTFDFEFKAVHNVGAMRTSLDFQFLVQVDRNTGKARASMNIDQLEADSLDEARLKMATWCTRMGAALHNVDRVPGDVPTFEKRSFELETQPSWVQAEFARLVPRFKACSTRVATETSSEILAEMTAEGNPLVYICGAYDQLQMLTYGDE